MDERHVRRCWKSFWQSKPPNTTFFGFSKNVVTFVGTYVSKTSYSVDSAVKKYFEYHKKSDILVNQSNSKI